MRSRVFAFLLIILLLLGAAPLGACSKTPGNDGATDVPTAEPKEDPTYTHLVCYWPENAGYENCDYALIFEKPVFSRERSSGYAFNQAVERYIKALSKRIEEEYMPSSVAKPPYTQVNCDVERVGNITNIVFTELHCYEAQPYTETHVLMLDERGEELSIGDVLLNYHAEELVSRRIAELIKGKSGYYEADAGKVLSALDLSSGVKATENGCVVYVHEGLLAPYEEGELAFSLTMEELLPDILGEGGMSLESYRSLNEFLGMAAAAVAVRQNTVENGVMDAYPATLFMADAAKRMGIRPESGRIRVPEKDFEAYYFRCFGSEFPGVSRDAYDIRHEDGVYAVLNSNQKYSYNVDIRSLERSGAELRITGDIVFGSFGYAFSEPVCPVTILLEEAPDSPFGFILHSLDLTS